MHPLSRAPFALVLVLVPFLVLALPACTGNPDLIEKLEKIKDKAEEVVVENAENPVDHDDDSQPEAPVDDGGAEPVPVPSPSPSLVPVTPVAGAARFVVSAPERATVGTQVLVTVVARDAEGELAWKFQDDVTLLVGGSVLGGGLVDVVDGVGYALVEDQVAEIALLELEDTHGTGLALDEPRLIEFTADQPAQIFVSGPAIGREKACSRAFQIELKDRFGNPAREVVGAHRLAVKVAGGARAYRDSNCAYPLQAVTVDGGGEASFYLSAEKASVASVEITSQDAPFPSASLKHRILPSSARMSSGRVRFGAARLANGMVLVSGGRDHRWLKGSRTLARSEVYDPASNRWVRVGDLAHARQEHASVVLPDGRALAIGGLSRKDRDTYVALDSVEAYDPELVMWTRGAAMLGARFGHAAVALGDGRVLVTGGRPSTDGNPLLSAEIYDPGTNLWVKAAPASIARANPTAVVLADGRVLVVGRENLSTAEIYDAAADAWSPAGALNVPRSGFSAVALPGGKVLVFGGKRQDGPRGLVLESELFEPGSMSWRLTGSMHEGRTGAASALLASGAVMAAGGRGGDEEGDDGLLSSVETYDAASGTWTKSGRLARARANAALVALSQDEAVLIGGETRWDKALESSEVTGLPPSYSDFDRIRSIYGRARVPSASELRLGESWDCSRVSKAYPGNTGGLVSVEDAFRFGLGADFSNSGSHGPDRFKLKKKALEGTVSSAHGLTKLKYKVRAWDGQLVVLLTAKTVIELPVAGYVCTVR